MRDRRRTSIFTAAVIVLAAACGGSDGDNAEPDSDPSAADNDNSDDDGGSDSNGDDAGGAGGDVPDGLPSDFYLPAGIASGPVFSTDTAISFTGTFESGTIDEIEADMIAGLTAAGYDLLSDGEFPVFAKNGVGRVRVRASEFLDELTLSVDIDRWTDEQLDELRALVAEPSSTAAQAVAVVDGATYTATGECVLQGPNRSFFSDDGSITIQIDETQDPTYTYADVTTPDGQVFGTEFGVDLDASASDSELELSGVMTDYADNADIPFTATATCG